MVHALGGSCLPRERGGCPHLSVRRSSSPASTCPITTAQFGGAVSRLKHRGSALVVSAGVRAPARASVETPRRAGSSEYSSIARFFVKTFYLDEDPSALLPGPCRALERDQAQDWSARYSGRGLQGAVFTTRVGRDLGATVSLGVTPFKGNQALQRLSDLSAPPEGSKLRPVIANLAVAKAFRRRGLAKALVRRCEEQVEDWGFDEVMLIVNARNNRARSLYRKLGYRVVGGQQGEEYVVREGEVQKAKVRNVVMRRSLKPGLAGFLDNLDWLTVVLVALGLSFLSQADKIPLESLSGLDLTSFDVRSYQQ